MLQLIIEKWLVLLKICCENIRLSPIKTYVIKFSWNLKFLLKEIVDLNITQFNFFTVIKEKAWRYCSCKDHQYKKNQTKVINLIHFMSKFGKKILSVSLENFRKIRKDILNWCISDGFIFFQFVIFVLLYSC